MAERQFTLTEIGLEGESQIRSPNSSELNPQAPPKKIRETTCGHQPYHLKGLCRSCYNQLPEQIEHRNKYNQLPETIEKRKEYKRTHIEIIKEKASIYRKNNSERIKLQSKFYREKHRQMHKRKTYPQMHDKEYIKRKKEERKAKAKIYREMHKEREKEYRRIYRANHKDEIKERLKLFREKHREEIRIKGIKYYYANRDKALQRGREYRKTHKCEGNEYLKLYRKNHPEMVKAQTKRCRERHRDLLNARKRADDSRVKQIVFSHYNNKCSCPGCNENRMEFLSIDHINGCGSKQRKELGGSGNNLYRWLIKNNFPDGIFKLLCFNCNHAKGRDSYCPVHEKEEYLITIRQTKIKEREYQNKKAVFNHYGNKCACPDCNESRIEFLSLDHINGDGAEHRKKVGGGNALYRWLIKNNFPSEYKLQLLCYNCNLAKSDSKYCPVHQS
jgi:rubredoxin